MDLFLKHTQLFTSQDINWWTGVVWITCVLWCLYELFRLSFWRHPFTAEDPLVSKWCNLKFLQIHLGWPEGEYIFIFGSTIPLRVKNKPYLRCCTLVQVDKGASGDRSNGRRGGTADSRGGCQGDGTGPVWHSDHCRRPRRCWSRVIHAHQPIINQTNPSLCVW